MSVRIGVVGVGWWATFSHIPTIQADPRATLVAIADLSAERLAIVGHRFQVANRYADYRIMIEEQKLDGLIVATPHVAHAEIAVHALARGWRGRQVDAVTVEYRRHEASKHWRDRRSYRQAFRRLRAKHIDLYNNPPESSLGPAGRAWYRLFWGYRPIPAVLELSVHRLRWGR